MRNLTPTYIGSPATLSLARNVFREYLAAELEMALARAPESYRLQGWRKAGGGKKGRHCRVTSRSGFPNK